MSAPGNCASSRRPGAAPRLPPSGSPARPARRCARSTARIRRRRRCRGSLVWQWSSITMPPRSPTASPAARASSSRGRMPAENTIRSVSSVVPSANTSLCRASFAVDDLLGALRGVDRDAQRLDLPAQQPAGRIVELHRHQARRELDHVRLEAEVLQRLGRLEAEQAAADHRADLRACRAAARDHFQVLDRAIDEAVAAVAARHSAARTGRSRWRAPACRTAPRGSAPSAPPCASRSMASTRSFEPQRDAVLLRRIASGTTFRSAADLPEKKLVSCTRSYAGRGSSQNTVTSTSSLDRRARPAARESAGPPCRCR